MQMRYLNCLAPFSLCPFFLCDQIIESDMVPLLAETFFRKPWLPAAYQPSLHVSHWRIFMGWWLPRAHRIVSVSLGRARIHHPSVSTLSPEDGLGQARRVKAGAALCHHSHVNTTCALWGGGHTALLPPASGVTAARDGWQVGSET